MFGRLKDDLIHFGILTSHKMFALDLLEKRKKLQKQKVNYYNQKV